MGAWNDRSNTRFLSAAIAAFSLLLLSTGGRAQSTDRSGVMEKPPASLSLHSVKVSPARAAAGTARWLVIELTASDPAAAAERLALVFSYSILKGSETVFSSGDIELPVPPGERALRHREIEAAKPGSFTLLAKVTYGDLEQSLAAGYHVESGEQEQPEGRQPPAPAPDVLRRDVGEPQSPVLTPPAPGPPPPPPVDTRPATIYLIRKKKFLGSAIRDQVSLDGMAWGQLRSGTYLEAQVAAGAHLIQIGGPSHRKGFRVHQRYTLKPGQVLYLFRNWSAGGAKTGPIDSSEATSYLGKYKPAGRF